MRMLFRFSSLASTSWSSMDAGWSCSAIHLATPEAATASASPGRGPYARRLRTCRACYSGGQSILGRELLSEAGGAVGAVGGAADALEAATVAAGGGIATRREPEHEVSKARDNAETLIFVLMIFPVISFRYGDCIEPVV